MQRQCAAAPLGNGTIRFMRQRELVDFAVDWIENHRGRPD
ncbi:MAG: AAC(3) family N-acetyltransferase [Collinsella sp.]|nr:AAC(3) family N-acetyltransferase [Collinsella sp.]